MPDPTLQESSAPILTSLEHALREAAARARALAQALDELRRALRGRDGISEMDRPRARRALERHGSLGGGRFR
jgi:hypothetical protein